MPFSLSTVAARLLAPTREALALWALVVFAGSLGLFLWGVTAARDI